MYNVNLKVFQICSHISNSFRFWDVIHSKSLKWVNKMKWNKKAIGNFKKHFDANGKRNISHYYEKRKNETAQKMIAC